MAIQLYCDCGNPLVLPNHLGGRKVKCKLCGKVLGVPERAEGEGPPRDGEDELISQSGDYEVVSEGGAPAPGRSKPKRGRSCPSCGAAAAPSDLTCLSCGAELEGGEPVSLGPLDAIPRPVLFLLVALVGFGGLGFVGFKLWEASRPSAYTQEGLDALQRQDLAAARTAFEEALAYDPQHAGAVVGLADVGVAQRDHALVRDYVPRALRVVQDKAHKARLELAYARDLLARERYLEAFNAANDAAHDDPELAGSAAIKGLAAVGLGKDDDAFIFLQEAAEGSDDFRVHQELARLHREREDWSAGLSHAEEAARLRQDDPGLWLLLAELRERAGQLAAAREALLRVVQLEPENAPAHSRLSRLYLEGGELELALRSAEEARDLAPEELEARLAVGRILLALDRVEPAKVELEKALELGKSWEAEFLHGVALVRSGDVAAGARKIRAVVDQRTEDGDLQLEGGRRLLEAGELTQAAPLLERAVARQPDSYEAKVYYARALAGQPQGQRHKQTIVAALEAAIELAPTRSEAYLALAQFFLDTTGDTAGAIAVFDRGLAQLPRDPELLYRKGRACVSARRWDEAVQALETLKRVQPGYEDVDQWHRKAVEGRFYNQ